MDVSQAVVLEVAALEGVALHDLPPLYETVDPEALNRTLESMEAGEGSITFTYTNYQVIVESDGNVTVKGKDANSGR